MNDELDRNDSDRSPWTPGADDLAREVRERLSPLCGHLESSDFDLLVSDVVSIRIKYLLHDHARATSVPERPKSVRPSLAQLIGNIPRAPRPTGLPPRSG